MSAKDDRTEKPTGRRLSDAKKKGQVARSRESGQTAALAASVLALSWLGVPIVNTLCRFVSGGLQVTGERARASLGVGDFHALALVSLRDLALTVGPLACAAMIASLAVQVQQGGWVISGEPLKINFGKLSPAAGLKRLAPSVAGIDTLRMMATAGVISYLGWRVIHAAVAGSATFGRVAPAQAAAMGWADIRRYLWQVVLVLIVFSVIDWVVQRQRHTKALKMTKQEVKDDSKMTDGNPEVKGRVRRVQREMVRRRMLASVKQATVVITNPTEYAVALEYRRESMSAPRVLAKGRGALAARIKAIAREHDIPTVENVPLARALYKAVDVGEVIPSALFEAVAEVLAYLIRLRRLVL